MDLMQKLGLIEKNIAVDSYIFDSLKQNENQAAFTHEQLEYLAQKKSLSLCIDPGWMPFEKLEESQHIGMSADVFEIFSKELPIPIKLYKTKSWDESIQALKERRCDISSLVMRPKSAKNICSLQSPISAYRLL